MNYKMLTKAALMIWLLGVMVFIFLFALEFSRGAFDCPPGTYAVNTVWVDAESGQSRTDSICVQQK
jgi:hypothetical protein